MSHVIAQNQEGNKPCSHPLRVLVGPFFYPHGYIQGVYEGLAKRFSCKGHATASPHRRGDRPVAPTCYASCLVVFLEIADASRSGTSCGNGAPPCFKRAIRWAG